jgi:DNA (cytosine-5)-methyltransferase 1
MKKNSNQSELKVVELFAGVGGFRIGLEGFAGKSSTSNYKKKIDTIFKTIWSNQWEPSTKIQHASMVYVDRFGEEGHSNVNIQDVDVTEIPSHDVLCGGFPCQDYSVAKILSKSQGIIGKKGVLWWDIHRIVSHHHPKYIFLENVDRLLKSPTKQRGRDFAIMISSLSDLGYVVEWRVVNASEYGFPQRRRRVFIVAYKKELDLVNDSVNILESDGIIPCGLPVQSINPILVKEFKIEGDLSEITEKFNLKGGLSPFENAGVIKNRLVTTYPVVPNFEGPFKTLGDIVLPFDDVPEEFQLKDKDFDKWKYLKGSKKEERKKSNGEIFFYNEGPVVFPDPLDKAARTIITSEGGSTPSRFKIVISQNGKLRRLHPIELERINMFPDNHTEISADTKRAFFMGNALVVGVIEKIGKSIEKHYLHSIE